MEKNNQETNPTPSAAPRDSSNQPTIIWAVIGVIVVVLVGVIVWFVMARNAADENSIIMFEPGFIDEPIDSLSESGISESVPSSSTDIATDAALITDDIIVDDATDELSTDLGDLDAFVNDPALNDISGGLDDLGSL
ncbi:MAG: hypothetical protein UY09_C0047G0010 [Parcubacteria group bacterium GW2011_GWA2_47_8]|nr:MAG: hypothetical protein UY09_C0047G0010 [Parcubacteria group bacterium GW2011_GWA2_47_8]OHB19354.1 MAG: hypothetical protein A2666_00320 [Parcubacteria group bacterium RIFCSPHIGHO2_01_FULL_47_10b]